MAKITRFLAFFFPSNLPLKGYSTVEIYRYAIFLGGNAAGGLHDPGLTHEPRGNKAKSNDLEFSYIFSSLDTSSFILHRTFVPRLVP
jgi:hypothetical protein